MKQWENIRITTGENYFNLTQTLYYLLVILPLGAFAVFYLEARSADFAPMLDPAMQKSLIIAIPLVAVLDVVVAFALYFRFRSEARLLGTLREKLARLFRANLWKYAGLFSATLLVALGMYFTRQEIMGAWAGLLIFLWSWNAPTRQRFGRELKLNKEEREVMVHGREIQ